MSPTDLVTYNGIQMRRDDAQSLEDAQHLTVYVAGETSAARLPFGIDTCPMVTPGDGLCPCCSAARGQLHEARAA